MRLTENRAARRYRGTTGIYHFAILLPNRRELARAIARLFALRWPNSPTDHIVTKTTYLDDPEGNNIELSTESPEDGTMGFADGALGFDDMGYAREFRMGMVSAGRYHHHVGLNTWMGEGAPPAPPGALGLRHISFVLPSGAELERVVARVRQAGVPIEQTELGPLVRDPSQNAVVLTSPN